MVIKKIREFLPDLFYDTAEYPEICSNFTMEGFAHTHRKTLQMRCFRWYNGKKEEWK